MELEVKDLVDPVGEYFQQSKFCIWMRQLSLRNKSKEAMLLNGAQK